MIVPPENVFFLQGRAFPYRPSSAAFTGDVVTPRVQFVETTLALVHGNGDIAVECTEPIGSSEIVKSSVTFCIIHNGKPEGKAVVLRTTRLCSAVR